MWIQPIHTISAILKSLYVAGPPTHTRSSYVPWCGLCTRYPTQRRWLCSAVWRNSLIRRFGTIRLTSSNVYFYKEHASPNPQCIHLRNVDDKLWLPQVSYCSLFRVVGDGKHCIYEFCLAKGRYEDYIQYGTIARLFKWQSKLSGEFLDQQSNCWLPKIDSAPCSSLC